MQQAPSVRAQPAQPCGVGTKNKDLKLNDHGSLTLYIQHDKPEVDQASNCPPGPDDEFSRVHPRHWPDAAITEGRWSPPAVAKVR